MNGDTPFFHEITGRKENNQMLHRIACVVDGSLILRAPF